MKQRNATFIGVDKREHDTEVHMSKQTETQKQSGGTMLDRRQLMAGGAALGATAVAATAIPAPAKAAKKGGHLAAGLAQGSTTDTLDPGLFENGFTITLSYTAQSKLTNIGNDGQLEGDLAKSWEGSNGAKKWVFELRDSEFHNGQKVTAHDVVASMNHHRGEESTSAAKPLLEDVSSIKADGDKTVIVELNGGNADFPFTLTDYHLSIGMRGTDDKVNWNDPGSQSGPYRLVEFAPGVTANYEKADTHWNPDIGHFDTAETIVIGDPLARQSALLSGQIDVCERPDTRTVDKLGATPNIDVEQSAGYRFHSYNMLMDVPPFDNNDVRLALKYAVDRQELVDKALSGFGTIANDHPITPAYRYYASDIPQRPYDPDKAKFHLKKAGVENLKVDLSAAGAAYASAVDAAQLYREQAKKAGIDITVVREPNDGYWSNVWMKKPFSACDWGGRPTEDQMFSVAFKSGVPWNDTRFNHPRFDDLLLQARSETDDALRKELYTEMQMIVRDEGGVIVPMLPSEVWAKNSRIQHDASISRAWQMDGLQFISRWWLDA